MSLVDLLRYAPELCARIECPHIIRLEQCPGDGICPMTHVREIHFFAIGANDERHFLGTTKPHSGSTERSKP